MALNRAQLVMGNSSQGVVLPGQIQGVTQGTGVSIAANGAISFDSTSATGVLKTNNPTAYNTYVWPTTIGAAGQQLQLGAGGALSWEDPGGIPWTAKGQLVVGTGLATSTILNVGSNGSILIADSSTTSGLSYTANFVATTGPTSAANLPAGAAATRPATPPAGAFRYNSTDTSLEFYNGVSWETVASSGTNLFVEKTSDTGIALIPAGTSAQRPVVSTYAGGFRFNSDLDTIEFSDGVAWKQLVMLNNLTGYNAYVWPNADGAYGAFLQTDAAGNLSWKNPAFVGTTTPTPASDGMLWYDCNVGYLKVYQSCVAPNGWTKVAEPGLPILTTNMSASPAFSSGSGSSASPYVVTTSTVAPGDSVLIPNTVTVTGLAPNQYVTIVDQNAVTNGGRYHFTNNFADSAGTLVFNIIFTDAPDSASGTNYTALIRVGYATGYIQSAVSVVAAVIPLSISSPGSISGATSVGSTLNYTTGTATGGTSPYTYAWVWKKASDDSVLQTNGATYVIPASLVGDRVYVTLTATDSVSATASGDTADYPAAPATITAAPVALSISNPGSISGTAQAGSTLTYTTGSATGGTSPYTYAWVWKKASDNSTLQTNGATYVIPGSLIGDRVYVTLTATDSVSATASGNTANYPASPAVITSSTFPNWAVAAPTTIPGITSGSWSDGTTSITSTNCIQISLDGVTFGQGPLSVSNGTTLYMQWEPTGASCGGAPSGTTITGTITNGTFTNSYSLTLDRNPDAFTFSDITGQALSTAVTSNSITISGTNCPTYITGTSATLTSVNVSVAGGAFVSLPTSGTTVTVNPGATVQVKGTTGASNGTGYSVTVNMGTTSDTWTVTTSAVVPTVTTPSILTPTNGATNLNPGLNVPVGLTVTSSAFASSGGAGTDHVSSDWQLATDAAFTTVVYSVSASTTQKVSLFIPQASLVVSTTYYVRVRYQSGTAGGGVATLSSYSPGSSFTTNSYFGLLIGQSLGGGYYGGQIKVFAGQEGGGLPAADTIYNLIVAPVADGQFPGALPAAIYKTTLTADPNPPSQNLVYGGLATTTYNDPDHPVFQWAKGLSIAGFTDWYIPAQNELEILYFNLKPSPEANSTSPINPNSVPPRATPYTSTNPTTTTANGTNGTANFQSGGTQAFDTSSFYWSSSEDPSSTDSAWVQTFYSGLQSPGLKTGSLWARAIRRIAA